MLEIIACLTRGAVELLHGQDRTSEPLHSPYRVRAGASAADRLASPITSVTRGRRRGELYYAIRAPNGTALFAQTPGEAEEQQLFHGVDVQISEIDFSFGDEALACTVPGPRGTSAIGSLADDGKGVRTVTEGDVVDCMPHWVAGGRGEIVYASAGIGRTQSGEWGGRSPFALHRLRFADNSVEVLTADAKYDYLAPVAASGALLFAIRRPYRAPRPPSPLAAFFRAFRRENEPPHDPRERELVRITERGVETLASGVVAFDVAANGDLIYATTSNVFRGSEPIAALEHIEQLVIC